MRVIITVNAEDVRVGDELVEFRRHKVGEIKRWISIGDQQIVSLDEFHFVADAPVRIVRTDPEIQRRVDAGYH